MDANETAGPSAESHDPAESVAIGTAERIQAGRYQDLLAREGVTAELVHNPQTCQSGCRTTVEIWVPRADLETVKKVLQQEEARNWQGLDFDPELLGQVFDPNKDQATCPACGTQFSTSHSECPDCGLNVGGG